MILSPKQDCIPAWELLLVCGASMFLVAGGGGLEDFLRKLEAAQRELQLPALDAEEGPPQRQRRNVVKRPGVSYERADDDALGLRGAGAGSDDADQESLQGFEEPSLSDNEASDEAAILRELEEINSGSDTVKRGAKSSKRNKRQRHQTARAYDDVPTNDQGSELYRDLSRAMGYAGRQPYAGDRTFKEAEKSKQFQTPSEDHYRMESMSRHDLASPEAGHPTLRMRGLYGNSTADGSSSQSLLDGMQHTRENILLPDRYVSSGMDSYSRNVQRSLLDTESEMDRPDSHEEIFQQKSPRKANNIRSSDISSQIGNEDDTPQRYHFRNLDNELESDMVEDNRNSALIRREHKIVPYQKNSHVYRQQHGQAKDEIVSGYEAPFRDREVEMSQDGRMEKSNFGGVDTNRKKLSGRKLERWGELNNDDVNSYGSGRSRQMSYTGRRPEETDYRHDSERRTFMEQAPQSKHERGTMHEQNSKYRKLTGFRYSIAPATNYDSKKQRKTATKKKESLNREKYFMVQQPRSERLKSHFSGKQKHSLRHVVGNDVAAAATKEQLILEDSPGNFDLFDMAHSSRQRSSAKSPKDDESFHFLWDHQFGNNHHNPSSNETKEGNEEVHTLEHMEKTSENVSINIEKTRETQHHTPSGPHEDPAMADVHSGKTIVGIVDEVMRQVEKSKEVNKHIGPFLKRDHEAEAEVHRPPEATACAGHPCPNALLSKLTNAVAEIVNEEVSVARCEPMAERLRCFATWLLQGAHEEFRPKNPGYVDPQHLAFYAAYYKEPGPTPPVPPVTEHPPHEEAAGGEGAAEGENPCAGRGANGGRGKGACAASSGGSASDEEDEEDERERQIRLLKQLLKEYHALSAREQTRLHSVHQYLEQQLAALHGASTAFTSATHLPGHTAQVGIGIEEEGVAEELATRHLDVLEEGGALEPSLLDNPVEPTLMKAPLESELEQPQETNLEPQEHHEQVAEQEAAPVMADDFGAPPGAGGAAEASVGGEAVAEAGGGHGIGEAPEMEPPVTQDAMAQTVAPLLGEEELIQKDLELLGLGNSSNFGTRFNLAPLGNQQQEEQPQTEEEAPEGEARTRARMQKRDAAAAAAAADHTVAHRQPRNATHPTESPLHDDKLLSPQPMMAEHLLTDAEERSVVRPLLDNADSLQRRRR